MYRSYFVFVVIALLIVTSSCSIPILVIDSFADVQYLVTPVTMASGNTISQGNLANVLGGSRTLTNHFEGTATSILTSSIGGRFWMLSVPEGNSAFFTVSYSTLEELDLTVGNAIGISLTAASMPIHSNTVTIEIHIDSCLTSIQIPTDGHDHEFLLPFDTMWGSCTRNSFKNADNINIIVRLIDGWVSISQLFTYRTGSGATTVGTNSQVTIDLDEFHLGSGESVLTVALPLGTSSNVIRSIQQEQTGNFGDERDIVIWVQSAIANSIIRAANENDKLIIEVPAACNVMISLQYDGVDHSSSIARTHLNLNLLGSSSGFEFISSQSQTILVQIITFSREESTQCTALHIVPASELPVVTQVSFGEFSHGCDLYKIGAIQFTVQAPSLRTQLRMTLHSFYLIQ